MGCSFWIRMTTEGLISPKAWVKATVPSPDPRPPMTRKPVRARPSRRASRSIGSSHHSIATSSIACSSQTMVQAFVPENRSG